MEPSAQGGVYKKRKLKKDDMSDTPSPKKQKQCPSSNTTSGHTGQQGFFADLVLFILKAGLGKARTDIFSKQVAKCGGKITLSLQAGNVTHLVVDEQMTIDRMCRIMKIKEPPQDVKILKANWISRCLSEEKLVPTEDYELEVAPLPKSLAEEETNVEGNSECDFDIKSHKTGQDGVVKKDNQTDEAITDDVPSSSTAAEVVDRSVLPSTIGQRISGHDSDDSSYVPSDDEDYQKVLESPGQSSSNTSTPNASPAKLPKGNWVCSRPSSSIVVNHNKLITEKLEVLLKTYENTRDRWRALSYKKAISALKRHPKDITSWEEANNIPGIGKALADKVWEIARTGHLRKIDHLCKGEEMEALNLFNNIWGVGPTVAQEWVTQGLRTLDDVRTKAKLNSQQQIGMKHYDDFLERMPREEAGAIERKVREMAKSLHPDMMAVVCGSYRRGKLTCGDVDVLITNPDNKALKGVLAKLLDGLKQKGFITDDLIRIEDDGEQRKYMGVCKLPGDTSKYRRIDMIVAPYNEYPCALLHFTGSGHFNRSMRALAKTKGMSLSEHAMCTGVVRSGTAKIHKGTPLRVTCEEDVFKYLGLVYRAPEERDH